MTVEECEELIAAAEQRLVMYRRDQERVIGGTSPYFRTLASHAELRIRTCELRLQELQARLAELRSA